MKATPAEANSLVQDTDGEVAHGDFSYCSVVLGTQDHMLHMLSIVLHATCSVKDIPMDFIEKD